MFFSKVQEGKRGEQKDGGKNQRKRKHKGNNKPFSVPILITKQKVLRNTECSVMHARLKDCTVHLPLPNSGLAVSEDSSTKY